jgi:flavodoxin
MLRNLVFRYCALLFFAVPLPSKNLINDENNNCDSHSPSGAVETDGYTFDDSEAVIDGKFIGLPLDDINEDDQTDTRIEAWIAQISPDLA